MFILRELKICLQPASFFCDLPLYLLLQIRFPTRRRLDYILTS
jgi:hypothetical protein